TVRDRGASDERRGDPHGAALPARGRAGVSDSEMPFESAARGRAALPRRRTGVGGPSERNSEGSYMSVGTIFSGSSALERESGGAGRRARPAAPTTLRIVGGRVLDPASGVDRHADVRVRQGRIAAIEPALPAEE